MPALLASDNVQATAHGARLIGTAPSTNVHVRKGLQAHHDKADSVSWQVKRLTVGRSLSLDSWRVGVRSGVENAYETLHICSLSNVTSYISEAEDKVRTDHLARPHAPDCCCSTEQRSKAQ